MADVAWLSATVVAGPQAPGVSAKASGAAGTATTGGVVSQATLSTFIISVSAAAGATINTPTDFYSNVYTAAGVVQTSGSYTRQVFKCENGAGGAGHTATGTIVGMDLTVLFLEIKNSAASSYDVGSLAAADDTSASPYDVTSGTFAQANNIVVCALATDSGSNPATYAENSALGFVVQIQETNGAANWTAALATLVITSTSAIAPSFTCLGANRMSLKIFGIKA